VPARPKDLAEAIELAEHRLADGLNHVGELGVTIADLGVVGQAYRRAAGERASRPPRGSRAR
jgi:hypothetical protein